MSIATEHQPCNGRRATVAEWATDCACVAVAGDVDGYLAPGVAEPDLGVGYRHREQRIAEEAHVDAQPMIFHLFGDFALQILF
jgi:hypothetical protein